MKKYCIAIVVMISAGCFGTRPAEPRVQHYLPSLEPMQGVEALPYSLKVGDFTLAPHLEGDRLAARTSAFELEYYSRHRWAGPLDRLITQECVAFLRPAFHTVTGRDFAAPADYLLTGRLESFEELDTQDRWVGYVAVFLELADAKTGKVLWAKPLEGKDWAAARNPQAVVDVLRRKMGELLHQAFNEWKPLLGK